MRDPAPRPRRPSGRLAAGASALTDPGGCARDARAGVAPTVSGGAGDGEQDAAPPGSDAPVLRLAGYEGPLDMLLERARAGRVDLRRLPVLALVKQCVTAVGAALRALRVLATAPGDAVDRAGSAGDAGTPDPSLPRLAEWVGMAAWLVRLRTRLLLPEHDPEAQAARDEADALRRGLAQRAAVHGAVGWLDARLQLGRDVFACGAAAAEAREAAEHAAVEQATLLRAYARRIERAATGQGRDVADAAYRPRPPRLWRVPDALRRIERLLAGEITDPDAAGNVGTDLWRLLPGVEDLNVAGLALAGPDPALLARSAAASTFMAALELARQGRITLAQEGTLAPVVVRARHGPPPASSDRRTARGVTASR